MVVMSAEVIINAARVVAEVCCTATSVESAVHARQLMVVKYVLLYQQCGFPLRLELW